MSARSCRSKFGNNHVELSATCPQSSKSRACDSRVTGLWDVIFEVHVCLWMCDIVGLTRVFVDLSRRLITNWRLCIRFALETQKKKFSGLASPRCLARLAGLSKLGIVRIYCVPQHLHRTVATPHLFVGLAVVGLPSFVLFLMYAPHAPVSTTSLHSHPLALQCGSVPATSFHSIVLSPSTSFIPAPIGQEGLDNRRAPPNEAKATATHTSQAKSAQRAFRRGLARIPWTSPLLIVNRQRVHVSTFRPFSSHIA